MQRLTIPLVLALTTLSLPALADPGASTSGDPQEGTWGPPVLDSPPADTPPAPAPAPTPAPEPVPEVTQPAPLPEGTPIPENPAATQQNAPDQQGALGQGYALFAQRAPAYATLWLRGFDVSWESRPHRLRRLGFTADAASPREGAAPVGAIDATVEGGDWASGPRAEDTPDVGVRYEGFATKTPVLRGAVRTAIVGSGETGSPANVTIPVQVTLPQGSPAGAAVFLQGFTLVTDPGHPEGYTPQTIGVSVGPATVREGVATFDVTVEVDAARVPDRGEGLKDYGAQVDVAWALVPADPQRVHRLQAAGTAEHGIALEAALTAPAPLHLPVSVDLAPGVTDAASGISGFNVRVDEGGRDAGRYLRALTVDLSSASVDPYRNRWDGTVDLRFSNAGPVTRPIDAQLSADITVLELTPGQTEWSGAWNGALHGTRGRIAYPGAGRAGTR